MENLSHTQDEKNNDIHPSGRNRKKDKNEKARGKNVAEKSYTGGRAVRDDNVDTTDMGKEDGVRASLNEINRTEQESQVGEATKLYRASEEGKVKAANAANVSNAANVANVSNGDNGANKRIGDNGANKLIGDNGANKLIGDNGANKLIGDNGANKLIGDNGANKLIGDNGANELIGDNGANKLIGDNGANKLIGDNGVNKPNVNLSAESEDKKSVIAESKSVKSNTCVVNSNANVANSNDGEDAKENGDTRTSLQSNKLNDITENEKKEKMKEKNSLNNGELIVEPLIFEEKLKMWKGTVNSLKEKREDEMKLQQQRQLNVENLKLVHSLKKEEEMYEQRYLNQLKNDEELAKKLEIELNKDIRNKLSIIEQEDHKLATIIQNSFESEQSTICDDEHIKKKSKIKLLKEKLKSIFKWN
ncbi:conserved Plasmodium protein, unknown function [Plasmodium ovale curtisi]|uniref:Uncharacterized protein n=1 Tax=Plasmodium ovale curtisi TaxID=864141 RepID=A0A1A8VX81_PLAOA|nr:conserved Plasmodium protein, unknown function [Plasmodium ovale curtisi]